MKIQSTYLQTYYYDNFLIIPEHLYPLLLLFFQLTFIMVKIQKFFDTIFIENLFKIIIDLYGNRKSVPFNSHGSKKSLPPWC